MQSQPNPSGRKGRIIGSESKLKKPSKYEEKYYIIFAVLSKYIGKVVMPAK